MEQQEQFLKKKQPFVGFSTGIIEGISWIILEESLGIICKAEFVKENSMGISKKDAADMLEEIPLILKKSMKIKIFSQTFFWKKSQQELLKDALKNFFKES